MKLTKRISAKWLSKTQIEVVVSSETTYDSFVLDVTPSKVEVTAIAATEEKQADSIAESPVVEEDVDHE